jgi:hypothetical protein
MGKNASRKRRREGGTGEPIVFDPEARSAYLRGFSKRKEERRAYGLAMQKVKDRKARLEQRAELKQAEKEQVEEAERQKRSQIEESMALNIAQKVTGVGLVSVSGATGDAKSDCDEMGTFEKVETYEDEQTRTQWGGEVIVTTSSRIPGYSDDEDEKRAKKRRNVDTEQEYAGNVEKYLSEIKAKLPSKKKNKDVRRKHKGVHGASNMKGIAGSGDMKVAKRALDRFKQKGAGKGKQHQSTSSTSSRRKRH